MNHLSQLALLLTTMLLLIFPFVPTLYEWLQPSDDAPLPIDQNATYELRHFADSMHNLVAHLLGPEPTSEHMHHVGKTLFHNGTQVNIFHDNDGLDVLATGVELQAAGKLAHIVIFADIAKIASGCETMADIFAMRDIHVGPSVHLRSCCSKGYMRLAQNVLIHRWIDAETILAGRDLVVHGRITALRSITFSDHSQFVRAGAPIIYFGDKDSRYVSAVAVPLPVLNKQRFLFDGDTTILEEMVCDADVIVRGSAQIAMDCVISGSIKAHDFLRLQENVSVAGSMIAGKGIVIGAGCAILGPLISEDDIIIGPNSVIGSALVPTTVICRRLIVAQGVIIHGVVTTQDSAHVVFEEISFGI